MTRETIIELLKKDKKQRGECLISTALEVAIKALEQEGYYKDLAQSYEKTIVKLTEAITERQPCEDCVSRKAVLAIAGDSCLDLNSFEDTKEFCDEIKGLPPVTPTQRWIPVSEKLPNDRDWYLGIFKEPDTGWINPLPFICDYVGSETKATTKEYWILRGFTDMDGHIDYYFNLECVAWMPLPKPYESEVAKNEKTNL